MLCMLLLSGCGAGQKAPDPELDRYQYRDTKELVRFVHDAAQRLREEGPEGIEELRRNRERYRTPDYYLYVYGMDGTNLFHAGMPELEGRNLLDATDKDGRKVTRLILDALRNQRNPHAWVHYTWWEPGKFYPVPKSSCHFSVEMPGDSTIFVGAGLDFPHEEKEFARIAVDDAVALIGKDGAQALARIADPLSGCNFRDVSVFVFRADGSMLVSPVLNGVDPRMNIVECVDEAGQRPFAKALDQLREKDRCWQVFMARSRYRRQPVKKGIYLRKTMLDGLEVYVGAVTALPEPP